MRPGARAPPVRRALAGLDRLLVIISATALVAITLLTTVSVIGRYLFNAPIPDDLVMNENLMVFVVFLPLSYVQRHREHVFVAAFTDWLSGRALRALEVFGLAVGLGIFTAFAIATFSDFHAAWRIGAYIEGPLELPEWPGRLAVCLGLSVFSLRLLVDLLATVTDLVRRRA